MMEQLKTSVREIKEQLNAQAAQLQWIVTRFGGVEETTAALPDGITLPCSSLDDVHQLEVVIGDQANRTKLVNSSQLSTKH